MNQAYKTDICNVFSLYWYTLPPSAPYQAVMAVHSTVVQACLPTSPRGRWPTYHWRGNTTHESHTRLTKPPRNKWVLASAYIALFPGPIHLQNNAGSPPRPGIDCMALVWLCVRTYVGRSKRNRSKSCDPMSFPPSKRRVGTSSHGRAQTSNASRGSGRPQRERDDFRKALVNLIMWVYNYSLKEGSQYTQTRCSVGGCCTILRRNRLKFYSCDSVATISRQQLHVLWTRL